jgi:hypothetical protein
MTTDVAQRLQGKFGHLCEPIEVSLLGDVREAAERYREAEANRRRVLEELRAAIRAAHDEGVPLARIAREAGISREYARRLYGE